MKLELKHLAGYLPYGLKVSKIHTLNIGNGIGSISHVLTTKSNNYKPILRPLSDLTKEIEVNGEKFVPIERLRKEYSGFYFESNPELLIKSKNTNLYVSLNWTNEFQQKLYEWHFDLFSLIENNLAINVNDIK